MHVAIAQLAVYRRCSLFLAAFGALYLQALDGNCKEAVYLMIHSANDKSVIGRCTVYST